MSGTLPEIERERQLRDFVSRYLNWPDPEGPATVDVLPVGYPDELPAELVDYADLRFLGSVVRRRAGELLGIELLFEMSTGVNDLLERYERGLIELGWRGVNQPGLHRGGFEGSGMPLASTLVNTKKRTRVYIQTFDQQNGSLLRVHYHPPSEEELPDDLSPDAPPGRSPLPALRAPAGVRMRSSGSSGGGGGWSSQARAKTELAPMELEAHFAKQLESAGSGRVGGSADDFFAWSSWLVPAVPPATEWRGVLEVLAPFAGERALMLWMENVRR